MRSKTTAAFRKLLNGLPALAKSDAKKAYKNFRVDPSHPGLQFKLVVKKLKIYSVRINLNYRALGVLIDDTIVWHWIGSHADYDKLL